MFYEAFTMKDVGTRSFCALVWHAVFPGSVSTQHSCQSSYSDSQKLSSENTWKEECFVYWANQMSTESSNVKLNF